MARTKMNENVKIVIWYGFFRSVWSSLFNQAPFSYYVLHVTHRNTTRVGVVQGINGVVNLLTAIPFGWLGDKWKRQSVLRVAGCIGIASTAFTMFVLLYLPSHWPHYMYAALCATSGLWGIWMGAHSATIEAIFGDSVESGRRSKVYAWKQAMRIIGNAVGPFTSVAVFYYCHNKWTQGNLTHVMLSGLVTGLVPCCMLFCLRDAKSLGELSESLLKMDAQKLEEEQRLSSGEGSSNALLGPGTSASAEDAACPGPTPDRDASGAAEAGMDVVDSSGGDDGGEASHSRRFCCFGVGSIPGLCAVSDTTAMLGAGMTINFFPLWFGEPLTKGGLGFSPIGVFTVYGCAPLGISVFTIVMQKVATRLGRIETTLCCKAGGVSLLCVLAFAHRPAVCVGAYLVRTWLMNCTGALTKSILNDYVSKAHRAKWNALESINLFSWSGSATVGGYLITKIGYRHTFLVTAALQFIAAVMLVPLLWIVQREKGTSRAAAASS